MIRGYMRAIRAHLMQIPYRRRRRAQFEYSYESVGTLPPRLTSGALRANHNPARSLTRDHPRSGKCARNRDSICERTSAARYMPVPPAVYTIQSASRRLCARADYPRERGELRRKDIARYVPSPPTLRRCSLLRSHWHRIRAYTLQPRRYRRGGERPPIIIDADGGKVTGSFSRRTRASITHVAREDARGNVYLAH